MTNPKMPAGESYGRTAILFYEDQKPWKIVRYNEEKDKNEVEELFYARESEDVLGMSEFARQTSRLILCNSPKP